jgi:hypothetical protein
MVAAGALIACWYALLAGLRRLLSAGFWLSLAADVAFGVGTAAIFCGALVAGNYGRVRLYPIVGTLAGFVLCAMGLLPPVRRAAATLKSVFRHIFVKIRDFRWINVIFK